MFTKGGDCPLVYETYTEEAIDEIQRLIDADNTLKLYKPPKDTQHDIDGFDVYMMTRSHELSRQQCVLLQIRQSLGYDPKKGVYKGVGGRPHFMSVYDGVLNFSRTGLRAEDLDAISKGQIITNLKELYVHANDIGADVLSGTAYSSLERICALHPELTTLLLPPHMEVVLSGMAFNGCILYPRLMKVLGYTIDKETLWSESLLARDYRLLSHTTVTWIHEMLKESRCPRWLMDDEPAECLYTGCNGALKSKALLMARILDNVRKGVGGPAACFLHHFIRGMVSIHSVQKMKTMDERRRWLANVFNGPGPLPSRPTATIMIQEAIGFGVTPPTLFKILHAWFEYTVRHLVVVHIELANERSDPGSSHRTRVFLASGRVGTGMDTLPDADEKRHEYLSEIEMCLLRYEYEHGRPFFAPDCMKKASSAKSKKAKKDRDKDKTNRCRLPDGPVALDMLQVWNTTRRPAVAWFRANAPQVGATGARLWNPTGTIVIDGSMPFTMFDQLLPFWWQRMVRQFAIIRQCYIQRHCWNRVLPAYSEMDGDHDEDAAAVPPSPPPPPPETSTSPPSATTTVPTYSPSWQSRWMEPGATLTTSVITAAARDWPAWAAAKEAAASKEERVGK